MSDEYTPETVTVRDAYTRALRQAFVAATTEHNAEFNRWLTAHDARVKAAALRDTAEYLDHFEGPGGRTSAHDRAGRDIIRLIRVRADETEKETGR